MKILKYLLYLVLALLVVGLILGFIGPKEYEAHREIVVDAPPEVVYPHFADLKKMDTWGPWNEADPNQKRTYAGEDGTVGSSSAWEGNDEVGKGIQTITNLVPNKSVTSDLHFIKPWESKSEGYTNLEAVEGGTKVTWGFRGKNEGLMARAMGAVMDMDDMVGPMFEKGLQNLKVLVEAEAKNAATRGPKEVDGYKIASVDFGGASYLGHREKIGMDKMKDFFAKHFGAAYGAVMKSGGKPAGAPTGVYFEWDEENSMTDVFAGVPVTAADKKKFEGKEMLEVPASKALKIEYMGGNMGSMGAHIAMDKMMKADGIELNDYVIEEYITDPEQEPDSTKWLTNIIYLVK